MSAYEEGLPPRESASGGLPRWGGGGREGVLCLQESWADPSQNQKSGWYASYWKAFLFDGFIVLFLSFGSSF